MKKYIIVLLFAFAFAVSAVETAMLKYAPDTAVGMAEINVAALLKHPSVLQSMNDPKIASARQEWENKSGVRLADWKKVVFFIGADGNVYSCLCVDVNPGLEKVLTQNGIEFKKLDISGKTVYQLPEAGPKKQSAELAEIAPGVILVGEKGRLAGYFKQKCGNAGALAKVVEKAPDYPVWLAFANRFTNSSGQISDPKELLATFRFVGKEQKDLEFKLMFYCNTPNGAEMLKNAVPMYAMMGLGLVFGNDPDLGSRIIACMKTEVSGTVLTVSMLLEEKLVEQIGEYLKQNSDRLTRKFGGKKAKKRKSRQAVPAVSAEQ
jgi:hypothetical protein